SVPATDNGEQRRPVFADCVIDWGRSLPSRRAGTGATQGSGCCGARRMADAAPRIEEGTLAAPIPSSRETQNIEMSEPWNPRHEMMNKIIPVLLVCLFLAESTAAIVIRHDVEDSEYRDLGRAYSPSTAYIRGCAATLIAPTWLLTAAHCVAGRVDDLFLIRHLESRYRIAGISLHPSYDDDNDEIFDIALIQLQDAIHGGQPVELYKGTDELDKEVVFVGRGVFGNGREGLIDRDHLERGATNTVLVVSPQLIGFRFNKPERATALEGISARGDSGGPAFIEIDSKRYVAGVSSWQERNGLREGTYDVFEYYTRVSSHIDWLKKTIRETEPAELPVHPILDAIKAGSLEQLKRAARADGKWSTDGAILSEAFYQVTETERLDLAEHLLAYDVSIGAVWINKKSIVDYALAQGWIDFFDTLMGEDQLSEEISLADSSAVQLLVSSLEEEQEITQRIELVLAKGADINASVSGETALLSAGWSKQSLPLMKFLIENGADVNFANRNGDTALIDAAELGKVETLKLLLAHGANPKHKNRRSETALDVAKKHDQKEAIKLLQSLD
ncbi:MAG: trypsin-like serine protease, partial [Acidobacteriota bacterium]